MAGSVTTHFEQRDNHLKSGDFFELETLPDVHVPQHRAFG